MAAKGPGPMPASSMMRTPCERPGHRVPARSVDAGDHGRLVAGRPATPVAVVDARAVKPRMAPVSSGHSGRRQVVAHVGHHEQAGTRDELGRALAPARG